MFKIMRKRHFGLFLLLPVLAVVALAGCHRRSPEARGEWIVEKITKELELNDAQKAKLVAIKEQILADRAEMKKARTQSANDLLAQVRSESIDTTKVKASLNEHLASFQKHADRVIDLVAEFHKSLTPAQKEIAAKKLEDLKSHFDHHDE